MKIISNLTIQLTTTTIIFGVILLVLGYFIGNVLPITGNIYQVGTGTTTVQTGTEQQQTTKVELSPDDDPKLGNDNAPVQVYEFSDFQCPFCRKFYTEGFSQLEDEYISTGKVLFVYKDFPLEQIHPSANIAAQYSQCANEQGKWNEFHRTVFEEQNVLDGGTVRSTVQFDENELKDWAEKAGLDMTELASCVSSGKYESEVQSDLQEGISSGVSGTPSFFIGNNEKGFTRIIGAQPYSSIKQAIDQYLE